MKNNILNPNLEDAQAMSILHSKTFELPTNEEILNLTKGDFVKICSESERFWAIVKEIDVEKRTIIGEVNNDLVNTAKHGLMLGNLIKLSYHNIYSIHKS